MVNPSLDALNFPTCCFVQVTLHLSQKGFLVYSHEINLLLLPVKYKIIKLPEKSQQKITSLAFVNSYQSLILYGYIHSISNCKKNNLNIKVTSFEAKTHILKFKHFFLFPCNQ